MSLDSLQTLAIAVLAVAALIQAIALWRIRNGER